MLFVLIPEFLGTPFTVMPEAKASLCLLPVLAQPWHPRVSVYLKSAGT